MISFNEFDRDTPAEDHTNFLVSSGIALHYPANINEAIKLAGRLETESPHQPPDGRIDHCGESRGCL